MYTVIIYIQNCLCVQYILLYLLLTLKYSCQRKQKIDISRYHLLDFGNVSLCQKCTLRFKCETVQVRDSFS